MCEDMARLALNMLDEVKAAINCLKDKTYLDTDGLPSMFFLNMSDTLAEPRCLLFNQSLSEQTISKI